VNGPEHYRQAEDILEEASNPAEPQLIAVQQARIALAQAHATLAMTALLARYMTSQGALGFADDEAWSAAVR
jgi:hypothetical protein